MMDMSEPVKRKPVKIAYVGGGSLNWAITLMSDLAYDTGLDAEVRLFDIDQSAAYRNAQIGTRFAKVSRGAPARYTACNTLGDALQGADIVVISILPGRFDDMAQDIGIPEKYGIPQSVGDTVGPGGFVRALRAIPMMADIARSIRDHAPNAYVCNLTNPMSVLTGVLYATFPSIKAWGECHEVTKIRRQVAWIANQQDPSAQYDHREVEVNVLGINHFTFVDRINLAGRDMMADYLEFVGKHATTGWAQTEPNKDDEHARYFGTRNLVAFDLLERFGIPAAAGDRHLAEFFPAEDYLAHPDRWGFALTPVSYRVRDRDSRRHFAAAIANGSIVPVAKRSDEALVDQISALMTGKAHVVNVNLPNVGQMEDLPLGTIVETNAVFSGLGICPVVAGKLPPALQAIIADHAGRQTDLLEAALVEDKETLFGLFRNDPLVSTLKTEGARTMFDEMLQATADWLPEKLKGAA